MEATASRPSFRQILASDHFQYGAEVVTARGPPPPESPTGSPNPPALLDDPRRTWISLTDNPAARRARRLDWLAAVRVASTVLHLTCKDMNRNGLETAACGRYAAEGFDNILC